MNRSNPKVSSTLAVEESRTISINRPLDSWTKNRELQRWIREVADLCEPEKIHLCDGSTTEYSSLCQQMVDSGLLIRLNSELRPRSFLARTHPSDVARLEEQTFICSVDRESAGPTNRWRDPDEMLSTLRALFRGAMRGRVMYVVPFSMGPIGSPFAYIGVQITDSPYVVSSMHLMTRVGVEVLSFLQEESFTACLHSLGAPLQPDSKELSWPCNTEQKYIVHFPEKRQIWSYGSGYGGNALLGKKCFALRIASVMGRDEGWLAEHMLILSITNPEGEKKYIAAAFPSACGKTNLAMMRPTLPGWRIETVGDDIAWMRIGSDGQLYAINPEAGFFGVATGTSAQSNPNAMQTIQSDTIFTNTALQESGDVWWEGLTKTPPEHLISWRGVEWSRDSVEPAAHPNCRFTTSAHNCPSMDANWQNPVPISAILFGGRRSSTIPLVYEAMSWQHGIFLGASISSETTAASFGKMGELRHDPFAMLPFCGYHMGEYFSHWLSMRERSTRLPRIYFCNWFRKSSSGEYLWPGFGENSRVLKWIFARSSGCATGVRSAIGILPSRSELDMENLSTSFDELFAIDKEAWRRECATLERYFQRFGSKLPKEIDEELKALKERLQE